MTETLKTQETVVEGLESGFAALGLLDSNEVEDSEEEEEIDAVYHEDPQVEMGSLNRGVSLRVYWLLRRHQFILPCSSSIKIFENRSATN